MIKNIRMKFFFNILVFAFASAASAALFAQTVDRPTLREGDKWIYRVQTDESIRGTTSSTIERWEASLSRVGSQTIALSRTRIDSSVPAAEKVFNVDWSFSRSLNGKNTVTVRPYDFPMQPGKTWKIETVEEKPSPGVKFQKIILQYKAIGWEEVIVPAGTFRALKVEAEGEWAKEFEPRGPAIASSTATGSEGATVVMQSRTVNTPPAASGRLYSAFWYVPEIKRDVKIVDEDTSSNGVLHKRNTQELESFVSMPSRVEHDRAYDAK